MVGVMSSKKLLTQLVLFLIIGGVVATVIRTVRARSVASGGDAQVTNLRSGDARVEEWGRESFPASDPPANY
jgi:hypothetical protein